MRFENKSVIVTGGGGKIGKAQRAQLRRAGLGTVEVLEGKLDAFAEG